MMSNIAKFKVGIVGSGQISRFHLLALKEIPSVDVIGILDTDVERAASAKRQWNLPEVFSSLPAMVKSGANVIHLLTPPSTHAPLALEALELGCHLFIEKPMALSQRDCESIEKLARAKNLQVCAGHSLLFDPFIRRGLELVKGGVIGKPLTFDYFRCQPPVPYFGGMLPETFRDGGGVFRDLGIHALYLAEAFLGRIEESTERFYNTGSVPNLTYDEWRVLLKCERGTAQIQMSWNVRPQQNVIIVQGTKGVLRIDLFGMHVTTKLSGHFPEHVNRIRNAFFEGCSMAAQIFANAFKVATGQIRQFQGIQDLVKEFYHVLEAGKTSPVPPERATSAVTWMEKIATKADEEKKKLLKPLNKVTSARILVTGANGFIGRNLVMRLLEGQERVRLFVRKPPPTEIASNRNVEVVLGDLGDPEAVNRALAGVETVYHVGATMRGAAHDFDRGTVLGTRLVVEASLRNRVKRFIYLSSLSVLHLARKSTTPVDENWPREPFPTRRGHYSRAKFEAEKIVVEALKQGLPAVILRPGEVIGPGAPLITSGVAQRLGRKFVTIGNGTLPVCSIYIDDLIDAILAASKAERAIGEIYHLVDSQELRQSEILHRYLVSQNIDGTVHHFPRWCAYFLAAGAQTVFRFLRRQSPLSIYRLQSALVPHSFDCHKAEKELGWTCRIGTNKGLNVALGLESIARIRADNAA